MNDFPVSRARDVLPSQDCPQHTETIQSLFSSPSEIHTEEEFPSRSDGLNSCFSTSPVPIEVSAPDPQESLSDHRLHSQSEPPDSKPVSRGCQVGTELPPLGVEVGASLRDSARAPHFLVISTKTCRSLGVRMPPSPQRVRIPSRQTPLPFPELIPAPARRVRYPTWLTAPPFPFPSSYVQVQTPSRYASPPPLGRSRASRCSLYLGC